MANPKNAPTAKPALGRPAARPAPAQAAPARPAPVAAAKPPTRRVVPPPAVPASELPTEAVTMLGKCTKVTPGGLSALQLSKDDGHHRSFLFTQV